MPFIQPIRLLLSISILCFFTVNSFGQILNVESLRKPNDSIPLIANTSLSLSLIKDKNRIFSLNNNAYLQYKRGRNLYLFVSSLATKEVNSRKIINKGTQHLRYNRRLDQRLSLEAFVQSQFDAISAIEFRGLIGAGLRVKLSRSEMYRFYIGSLTMYEYEKPDNNYTSKILKDWRNSTYFSCSIYPNANLSFVSTTYFQPLYTNFGDFRLSNDSSVSLAITKRLSFRATITYLYDTEPIASVPKEQYKFTNGLMWSF